MSAPLTCHPHEYHETTSKLKSFFDSKGFTEVHTQSRLSILAACENPFNISTFEYGGCVYPLPQTGQMWLEHELLKNPSAKGYYCQSTSYRNEPNPIVGRHQTIFPMFEFELHGGMDELMVMEKELLVHLGYSNFHEMNYMDAVEKYNPPGGELEHEHEQQMEKDYGNAVFLKNFPEYTSPFWNMARHPEQDEVLGKTSKKIDVIMHGIETIGSAERSCDAKQMKNTFDTITNGEYAQTLYDKFGKTRVVQELDTFLGNDFFVRSGGGIGVTRLIRSMGLKNKEQ